MKLDELKTANQAFAALVMSGDMIDPDMLRQLLRKFPTIHRRALELYRKSFESHEDKVRAILETMPRADLIYMTGDLSPKILAMAIRLHPEDAVTVLQERGERKGFNNDFMQCMAEAVAKSAVSAKKKDCFAWKLASADPHFAAYVAPAFPHLRFKLMCKFPRCVMDMVALFPDDAVKIALLHPDNAPDIINKYPDKKEEIENHFRLEN